MAGRGRGPMGRVSWTESRVKMSAGHVAVAVVSVSDDQDGGRRSEWASLFWGERQGLAGGSEGWHGCGRMTGW